MTYTAPEEPAARAGEAGGARISRRGLIRTAGGSALAFGLGGATLASAAPTARAAIRAAGGTVPQPPRLPSGFWNTFTSRYINVGDGLRLHAVTGGDGPPLLLVHGWPETWYAWRLVMPALAQDFQVIAVDQRGIGLSDKPASGYDTGTLARDLVTVMDALGHERFAVVGHDTGMPIGYALAADYRDRVERLAVAEAVIPGVTPSPPLFLPTAKDEQLFHLAFNKLPAMNEQLVKGREDIYFGYEFAVHAGTSQLPDYAVRYYVEVLAVQPHALRGSFGWYRELDTTTAQNEQRATRPLTQPVLAVGGAEGNGDGPANTMKLAAVDVQALVIPDCAHWVPEQAPEALLAGLAAFLAPYRQGSAVTTRR
jgi:pimeloyl-ACP methyl ester carboxylesterase